MSVKGQVWPLHPIRLLLISLFFRVEQRDEGRHWALSNPLCFLPSPLHPATLPPAVALSVALEEILGFQHKKSQHWPHTKQTYTHLRWHQDGKNEQTMSALLVWMEMPLEQGSDHSGTLKISPQVILVKFSVLWLQTGRGEFHCRFYRLQSKILPQHSGNVSTQTSDREIIKTRCSMIRGILIRS